MAKDYRIFFVDLDRKYAHALFGGVALGWNYEETLTCPDFTWSGNVFTSAEEALDRSRFIADVYIRLLCEVDHDTGTATIAEVKD